MIYWREESKAARITQLKLLFFNKLPFLFAIECNRLSVLEPLWVPAVSRGSCPPLWGGPRAQGRQPVPGLQGFSHRGSWDEAWGRRLSSLLHCLCDRTWVSYLPFPGWHVSPCFMWALPPPWLKSPKMLSQPDLQPTGLWVWVCSKKERLWPSLATQRRFSGKKKPQVQACAASWDNGSPTDFGEWHVEGVVCLYQQMVW